MLKYFGKKLLLMIVMVFVISLAIYAALDSTGVDPVAAALGVDNYTDAAAAAMRIKLGLDKPLIVRYFRWWKSILSGDLGFSIAHNYAIKDGLIGKWPASLEIALIALILSTIIGILIGILSAYWQNSIIDYLGRFFSVLGNSMPAYFFALILIQLFAVRWGLLPIGGRVPVGARTFWDRVPNLILPVMALTIPMFGNLVRYTRNTMLDMANQEYVKLARSKGIPEWKVYTKHIFRNSMRPIVTVLLFRTTMLFSGSVAVETIFSWPGVGPVLTDAITANDYPVIMIYTLFLSIIILIISFLVDMFTALLDPRVRTEF